MAKNVSQSTISKLTAKKTLFDKLELWAENNDSKLLIVFLSLSALFSLLLFNARISEANDDALYLEGGWRYVHEFPNYFYTQNAPLYVIFLGICTKIFGFKLLIFKIFNVVFQFSAVYFFYKAFSKRISYLILIPVMLFVSCNYLIQYYASMTFTEAFYFFWISFFFFTFFKHTDFIESEPNLKKQWKKWLLIGLLSFIISTTKSAGIVIVPSLFVYFIFIKQYKNAVISIMSYGIFKLLYELVIVIIFGKQNQFSEQSKILLLKDPYDRMLGNEDFLGFIQRIIDNSNLYLSKRFFQIIGFRNEMSFDVYWQITLLVIALFLVGIYFVIKNGQKPLLLFGIFSVAQLLLSFIILAARWDQARIVMICMPIMLTIIFYGMYHYLKTTDIKKSIYLVLVVFISSSVVLSSAKRGIKNIPIVKKNLAGDLYYGYTPDWQNFLKCSKWCADSLPANTLVASRKAPMSFVYANGKKFFPIYSVIKKDSLTNQSNPDSALAFFNQKAVTHIMIGSLRINPIQNTGQIINTVHNIIQPIMEKYPNKLKIIHTEGTTEQAYVLEILNQ